MQDFVDVDSYKNLSSGLLNDRNDAGKGNLKYYLALQILMRLNNAPVSNFRCPSYRVGGSIHEMPGQKSLDEEVRPAWLSSIVAPAVTEHRLQISV